MKKIGKIWTISGVFWNGREMIWKSSKGKNMHYYIAHAVHSLLAIMNGVGARGARNIEKIENLDVGKVRIFFWCLDAYCSIIVHLHGDFIYVFTCKLKFWLSVAMLSSTDLKSKKVQVFFRFFSYFEKKTSHFKISEPKEQGKKTFFWRKFPNLFWNFLGWKIIDRERGRLEDL